MLVVLGLAGCHRDEITSYRAARIEKPAEVEKPHSRFLGAIIPHEDRTWFVKLMGPEDVVKEQAEPFEQFVKSIRFQGQGEKPITWTAPAGWREAAGSKAGRYATFHVGPKDQPLELTVTALGKEGLAGDVLANVNRWRGQLGLKEITQDEIAKETRKVELDGAVATLVDITGADDAKMGQRPPFAGKLPVPPAQAALVYKSPPGWHELPAKGFRVAAFLVAEGDQHADVTVIPFPGDVGGLLANVNRWRNELGLAKIDSDQLKDVSHLKVAGADSPYVDLVGPEAGGRRLRTLAVSVPHAGRTWFFKMHGPADLVGKQKTAFEAFVASVQFPAGAGS
jgi:hypothetical protein